MENNTFSLLTIQPSKHQKLYTRLVSLFIVLAFFIILLFVDKQLIEVKSFLPAYAAVVIFTEWMTAYLLWNQYRITRSFAYLCLSMTYFYSGLIVIPHILTFPGIFSAEGLLGAGSQTAIYFWVFWHSGFPLGLILFYLFDRYEDKITLPQKVRNLLPFSLLLIVIGIIYFILIVTTVFHNFLPVIIQEGSYSSLLTTGVGSVSIIPSAIAALLFIGRKEKPVLHSLLLLSSLASLADVLLTVQGTSQYTVGWYAARLLSLFSSSVVLGAFILELNQLYVRLGKAHKQLEVTNNQLERQILKIARQKREIAQSEERYRLVVDHIHEVVFLMGKEGELVYVNPYWFTLTGYDWDESKDVSILQFVHLDEQEKMKKALYSLLYENREYIVQEVRLMHRQGHVIWAELFARGTRDENGTVQEIHGTIRDVTEQRARFELERNRVLGELAVAICHEVRNPLTATKGFLQLLKEEALDENIYLNISMDELNKAEKVLGDYLHFSKPNIQEMERVSIGKLIVYCVNVIEAYALSHNVHIHYSLQPELYVKADREMLSQAIINVMKNGIEAMHSGGVLTICTYSKGRLAVIEAQDTGTGMTGDQILRLGEPFYTLKEKGTGLGMMMTYQFIYAMKGEILVDSKVGFGTKISILLPAVSHVGKEEESNTAIV